LKGIRTSTSAKFLGFGGGPCSSWRHRYVSRGSTLPAMQRADTFLQAVGIQRADERGGKRVNLPWMEKLRTFNFLSSPYAMGKWVSRGASAEDDDTC
jgi:hypothetical protein